MAFLFTLAILSACALAPVPASNVSSPLLRCAGVICCVILSPGLAFGLRCIVLTRLKQTPDRARQHLRLYLRCERRFPIIWCLACLCALFVFQWPAVVRHTWQLDRALLIDELLLLLPVLLPWFLVWSIQYDVENFQRIHQGAPRATGFRHRCQFVVNQARSVLGIVVVPLLFVTFCWDLSGLWFPDFADSRMGWMMMLVPLTILFAGFPELLRILWPTYRLTDAGLRAQLFALAAKAELSVRDIVVWQTPSQMPNAAVTGILPSLQYVLLTKSLTDGFDRSEVHAAFAHELGHVRFHHNALRMLALIVPIVIVGGAADVTTMIVTWGGFDLTALTSQRTFCSLLLLSIAVTYLLFGFGWFCRQLEHQADLFACQLLTQAVGKEAALDQYSNLLDRLSVGSNRTQREWLHPSWHERQRFLRRVDEQDGFLDQFQVRMRRLSALVSVTTVVGCLACVCRAAAQ